MLFRNYSPFPPLQFESRDENQKDFGVIVLRGSFQIEPGRRLRLLQKQEPLVMADEYFGEPGKSSLHYESSIAPYKPTTDVLLAATAHSPTGRPETEWNVAVQVGSLRKELLVTGPRQWTREKNEWTLSPKSPTLTVPIRYEHAYGGSFPQGDKSRQHDANPIGIGMAANDANGPIPAPQILPIGTKELRFGQPIPVAGLGPIAPAWSPRREKAGTFGVIWEKTRWPDLPEDFSFEFYNTASTGLVLPRFADGTEEIRLANLTPGGSLSFSLPHFELATLLRFEDGRVLPGPIVLDTIQIEVDELKVFLTWRGVFPVNVPLRVLEVRMKAPSDVVERNTPARVAAGV